MSVRLLGTAAVALALALPAAAKDSHTTIHFAHNATAADLNGSLKGYDSANFMIAGAAGQTLAVSFKPSNASCYFNVNAPGSDEAIFNGSSDGNSFSGTLSAAGTYTIQAYLMRNEARRGTTCTFSLHVSLTGGAAAGGGASASAVSDDHMRGECKGAAAGMYGVKPVYVTLSNNGTIFPASDGFSIEGTVDKGNEGTKSFNCIFDTSRHLSEVMPLDSDGE